LDEIALRIPRRIFVINKLASTTAPAAVILIRLMVGGIFLSEGIQKFLYPAELAAGRFAKIGIPWPEVMGPFVGGVELICGLLVLFGLLTRIAAVPLIITMCVALISIKVPILLGQEFLGFSLRPLPRYGFWSMMHESRNDICMLLGSIFLFVVGAGKWSLDRMLFAKLKS
jgi:putative oxidoreductase